MPLKGRPTLSKNSSDNFKSGEPAPPADRPDTPPLEKRIRKACQCYLTMPDQCMYCEAADALAALRAELETVKQEPTAEHSWLTAQLESITAVFRRR